MRSSKPLGSALDLAGDLRGLRATVFGLGREGLDLARYLARQGACLTLTDSKPAEALGPALAALAELEARACLGGHDDPAVLDADVVFASPGVPPELPALEAARARGVPVSSATALLFARCPAPIVGITGSSGKTTTTALVGRILERTGRRVLTGGNIGVPLLNRLDELDRESLVVLELSSFQLEPLTRSPHVAAITNLTPNHLDRHPSMEAYARAKAQVLAHQGPDDWAILNADDPGSRVFTPRGRRLRFSLEQAVEGAYLDGDRLRLETPLITGVVCATGELRLRGRHNVANALAAGAVAAAAGAGLAEIGETLRAFEGVPHRLQLVGEVDGARFYNDSIATSPERSMAALASFDEPIVLLAGGKDKHLPLETWAARIRERVRHVVLFGQMAGQVEEALLAAGYPREQMEHAANLDDAAARAAGAARPGNVVLLSPGGTSYDLFRDFEERGEAFARAVRALEAGR